jgi:hypothetical protein
VPGCADEVAYVDAPAVRDRRLVTASDLADVEIARELPEELDVLTPEQRSPWAQMFHNAKLPKGTA